MILRHCNFFLSLGINRWRLYTTDSIAHTLKLAFVVFIYFGSNMTLQAFLPDDRFIDWCEASTTIECICTEKAFTEGSLFILFQEVMIFSSDSDNILSKFMHFNNSQTARTFHSYWFFTFKILSFLPFLLSG